MTAEVVRRLRDPIAVREGLSIGIVTFNGEQQRLIENLLDAERRSYPELEHFFDPARCKEPVFVKNLENVQGDERDVILFSVAVAPDQTGRAVATISSLNKEGGYRRLNVAITRARQEMVVFATLRADQIDLSRTNARGVRDFKHFLEFAERGPRALAEAFAATGRDTESPFEDAVKAALETRGWEVHPQIGVSDFRIDLGIVHPDAPGRYLAGAECDGATYHRSATARDRDRLREHVLTGLGWRIRRVWSTEWWSDAERALDRLDLALKADLERDRKDAAERALAEPARQADEEHAPLAVVEAASEASSEVPSTPAEMDGGNDMIPLPEAIPVISTHERPAHYAGPAGMFNGIAATVPTETRSAIRDYRLANLSDSGHEPDPARFYDPMFRSRLRAMTAHVIATEGPIFDDLLIHRVARGHGFLRAAGRIREAVLAAVDRGLPRTTEAGRTIFWPVGADPSAPTPFRRSSPEIRDYSDIPMPELVALASDFLRDGADTEETVRLMAAELGLRKLREAARSRLESAVAIAGAPSAIPPA